MIRNLSQRRAARLAVAALMLTATTGAYARPADSDETTFVYTSKPTRQWPAQQKNIAIEPPVFDHSGLTGGIMQSKDEALYRVFMGELKKLLQNGLGVTLVERIDMKNSTDETRRARNGTTDGSNVEIKLRHADATLIPSFTFTARDDAIQVKRDAWKRWAEGAAGFIPYVGHLVDAPKFTTISIRVVTVTCDLKINTLAGITLYTYSRTLTWKGQTRDGIFDFGNTDIRDLPLTEEVLKRLMGEHAQAFCGEFMPVRQEIKVNLHGLDSTLEPAILAFNSGHIMEASRLARTRYALHESDHRALFILGMCAESQNGWTEATEWYRRAVDLENLQIQYQNALERVRNRTMVGDLAAAETMAPPQGEYQQDNPDTGEVIVTPDRVK